MLRSAPKCAGALGWSSRSRWGDKNGRAVELTGQCEDLEKTIRVSELGRRKEY